jgi:hypothetical protein
MWHDKLGALRAELRAIELWNRPREAGILGNEIFLVGLQARQMRRLEIIRQINLLTKADRDSERCVGGRGNCRGQASEG